MKITTNPFADSPLAWRMLEISSVPATVVDGEGTIALVNDCLCDFLGYQPCELIGDSAEMILSKNLFQSSLSRTAQGVTDGACGTADQNDLGKTTALARPKWGTKILVSVSLNWFESLGQRYCLVQMSRNALRHPNRKRLQSERVAAISQMIGGLAHESRNALQKAVASLDLLELDLQYNPDQMKLSQRIRASIVELVDIYDEVRRYSEPIETKLEPIDLVNLFRESCREFEIERQDLGIEVIVTNESDCNKLVSADRQRMKQVFHHLIKNAMDATSGVVNLEIQCNRKRIQHSDTFVFKLRDHGSGLTQEALRRAFDAFFTTKQHGSGLGLTICRRIVEAHGGEITAKNHPYEGAVITLKLPLATEVSE
jgi:two-component system, LuxR family, sensor kinase FixL